VNVETIRRAPKVLLHDHLDGGLRPATIVELADETGYEGLPARDPAALVTWMHRGADRKDLVLYLETFAHTVGVMQTVGALERVARECAEDLAADGIVYAEVRFAPEQHQWLGLSLDEIVEAVVAGFGSGSADRNIRIGTILTAMRTRSPRASEIATLALRWRDRGVCGFDVAGPEAGFPPAAYLDAFEIARSGGVGVTIHAGEAFGPPSIREAVEICGADRIGHGVHIADDIERSSGEPTLGPVARLVLERQIPLELCPTSNVHSGAAVSIAAHPIGMLADLGFAVTVNTDNRLMSDISLSRELAGLAAAFGWGPPELRAVTVRAAEVAFQDAETRAALVRDVIEPAYTG
jgi:adenosine deaminase